jgi:hypothetical protein
MMSDEWKWCRARIAELEKDAARLDFADSERCRFDRAWSLRFANEPIRSVIDAELAKEPSCPK